MISRVSSLKVISYPASTDGSGFADMRVSFVKVFDFAVANCSTGGSHLKTLFALSVYSLAEGRVPSRRITRRNPRSRLFSPERPQSPKLGRLAAVIDEVAAAVFLGSIFMRAVSALITLGSTLKTRGYSHG